MGLVSLGTTAPTSQSATGKRTPTATYTPPPVDASGKARIRYVTRVDQLENIPADVRRSLELVADKYVFRSNDYYMSLIDWSDPNDPIRQLIIPRVEELNDWGILDASNEAAVTVARGVQHKYRRTVLLLCNEVCGAYCRYCFRKRLFMDDNDEVTLNVDDGIEYIRAHSEVTNVLLTGGDPLLLSTRRMLSIFQTLREIPHVRIVRVGTKMPAFNPWRVLDDPALLEGIREYTTADLRIYIMAHFDHPRELTPPAIDGLTALLDAGAVVVNQCPLIKGVNDDSDVLAELYRNLSFAGVAPYYLFQGRPTKGNEPYEVPLARGYELFNDARRQCGGLARSARYCMSHESGKVEVVGMDDRYMYLRYHQAKDPRDEFRFMVFHRDENAYWLDQLQPVANLGAPRLPSDEE